MLNAFFQEMFFTQTNQCDFFLVSLCPPLDAPLAQVHSAEEETAGFVCKLHFLFHFLKADQTLSKGSFILNHFNNYTPGKV